MKVISVADTILGIQPESNPLAILFNPVHYKSPTHSYELTTIPVLPIGDGAHYVELSSVAVELGIIAVIIMTALLLKRRPRISRTVWIIAAAYPGLICGLVLLQFLIGSAIWDIWPVLVLFGGLTATVVLLLLRRSERTIATH